MLPLVTMLLLPVMSLTAGAIALVGTYRGDDELETLGAMHMIALSLANLACWFVL